MKKHQIFKSNDFGIVLNKRGVSKILSIEFPEEEKKGNNKRHRKRIEQERDR